MVLSGNVSSTMSVSFWLYVVVNYDDISTQYQEYYSSTCEIHIHWPRVELIDSAVEKYTAFPRGLV